VVPVSSRLFPGPEREREGGRRRDFFLCVLQKSTKWSSSAFFVLFCSKTVIKVNLLKKTNCV